jgi:2-dehydropantoate 2-reductase
VLLEGPWGIAEVPIRASLDVADVAGSDFVFVTVKSQATDDAARAAESYWAGAIVVSIQNGINDRVLSRYVEPHRLVMGMTATNMAVVEPGRVSLQLGGATIVGPPAVESAESGSQAKSCRAVDEACALLQQIRCPELSFRAPRNALGMRYNKLAINALGYASCLSASNIISDAVASRPWREAVGLPIVKECRRVFTEVGVVPKSIPGVPKLRRIQRIMRLMHVPVIGTMLARAARRRFNRKPIVFSLLQDLRMGRSTEVDHINGEIVRLASTVGLEAPANGHVVRLVRELLDRGDGSFFTQEEVVARFESL